MPNQWLQQADAGEFCISKRAVRRLLQEVEEDQMADSDIDYDALYEGVQVTDDLLIKATLRVPARPMKHAVTQVLSGELVALYKARTALMAGDIQAVLDEDPETAKSMGTIYLSGGRALFKATSPALPAAPRNGPAPTHAKTERKMTPDGYVHVENAGSRGGKFWRDDKGNVRYGERPSGAFSAPASPENVVEHFRQYYAPQPFAAHNQMDLHEALMKSSVLSEADHQFMDWWHDNYDAILKMMGCNRKAVEAAGGLQHITFNVAGRPIGIGEAIEELFRANASLFVSDEEFGDIESPEDVLEAIRGLMERYRKALHEDPEVQALAQASAERREAEKNAYYLKAEQMASEFDPLASDMMTNEDPNDLAVRFTAAMAQMGLIKRGGKGGVAQKRMRGAIVPASDLLMTRTRDLGSLWKDDQLERMNAAQLMALHIATDAQESFSKDNTYDYDPMTRSELRSGVFDLLANKLGLAEDDDAARSTLKRKLEKVAEATMRAFTNYNTGQDPHFADVLKMKVKDLTGSSDIMDEHMKKVTAEQGRIEQILAAQEDTTFEVPPTMKDGVWNGKTLKDKNDPSKGVWAPFEYQKKYINWMLKVKRGVIAADAGMGKTPIVIAFREMLAAQGKDVPAICFLPPSLMEQWPGAIEKFAPGSSTDGSILNLSGFNLEERKVMLQSDMAKKAKYIFISTGTLTGDVPDPDATEEENDGTGGSDHEMVNILKSLNGAVFIDEAHQGGYKKAENTRHKIAKAVMADREYAFGMTATPMPNDPMDVYHLANLFAPGAVGDEELWAGRTAGAAWDDETGAYKVSNPEHLAELNKRLKPFVFYKSVTDPDVIEDMGKGLPLKTGVHELQEMHPDEGDLELSRHVNSENGLSQHDYFKEGGVIDTMVELRMNRLIRDRMEKVKNGDIDPKTGGPYGMYKESMLTLMAGGMTTMLQRQASISPALIDATYRKADGGVAHTPKMKALCDDIVAHFANGGQGGESGKPLVVFCSFPQKAYPLVRKALAERGVDPSLIETIAGDVAPSERGYMQDKLNKGHAKVLLVGTMSGGAGLNLQEAANKTLFLDEPWNPAAKRQATGRVWRTGQMSTVHEKTYRSVGTYDMAVEQKIAGKQAMVAALLGKELPTAATFDADKSIKDLQGRAKGTSFSEAQIKAIMENSKNYDMSDPAHKQAEAMLKEYDTDEWKESAAAGGKGGIAATLTDKDFAPNKDAQKTLKNKGAHSLAKHFDEKEFRGEWELGRQVRRLKQTHEGYTLMEKMYREKGDAAKADEYKSKTANLVEQAKGNHKHVAANEKKYRDQGDHKTADMWAGQAKQLTAFTSPGKKDDKKPKAGEKKPPKADEKKVVTGGKKEVEKEAAPKPPKPTPHPTATVKDAEEKLKKQKLGEPTKKPKDAPADAKPPEPVKNSTPSKVVASNAKLGVDFHTKTSPFKPDSSRKVQGTDITHGEAHFVLDQLLRSKHGNWNEFLSKVLKPLWDDEDGRNPFTLDAANAYTQKIVNVIEQQGVLTQSHAAPKGKK